MSAVENKQPLLSPVQGQVSVPVEEYGRAPASYPYQTLPANPNANANTSPNARVPAGGSGGGDEPKPQNVIASVLFLSIVVFALSIAALESTWYLGRLSTTPPSTCTSNCVTTAQTFELSIGMVKLTTSTSNSYKDYNQLVIPKTGAVMSAVRAFTIIVLVASLLTALLALIAWVDELRKAFVTSDLGSYIFEHSPRVLTAIAVLFSIGAVLMPLAFTHTFPADDVWRQTTAGAITCSSGQVSCSSFWLDETNTIGSETLNDQHRPTDAWWVAIVMFAFSVGSLIRVWKYKDIVTLKEEREVHDRNERAKRRS